MKIQRTAVVACLLAITGLSFGQNLERDDREGQGVPPPASMRRNPDRGQQGQRHEEMVARMLSNPKMAEELGLTEEQISQIHDQLGDLREEGKLLREKMKESGKKQVELLTAEPFDEAALMSAIEETGKVQTEIAKLRVRPMIILRKVLTPEQVQIVTQRMQDHRRRWQSPGDNDIRRQRRDKLPRDRDGKRPPRPDDHAGQRDSDDGDHEQDGE